MDIDFYVYVTNIVSRGGYGSAIFSGYEVDHEGNVLSSQKKMRIKATGKALNNITAYVGQTWHITESAIEKYTETINGFNKVINQLVPTKTRLHSKAGDNFIAFISGNDSFKGIGETKARLLWMRYGIEIYSILSRKDDKALAEVVSVNAAKKMIEAWMTEGCYSSLIWLDENNIPSSIGNKVVDYFKNQTREKIEQDPYRLIAFCASWPKVDALALHTFKIQLGDPRRLCGAIEEALYAAYSSKHTALNCSDLKGRIKTRLLPKDEDGNNIETIENLMLASKLTELALSEFKTNGSYYKSEDLYHPAGAYLMEQYIAEKVCEMTEADVGEGIPLADVNDAISEFEELNKDSLPGGLADAQKQAVIYSVYSSLLLISGGAGTGKTTVLKCVYHVLEKYDVSIIQMALAGRAAKRMQDATGKESYTIAGYLKAFENEPDKIPDNACVVVDEASMLDVILAYRVMRTLKKNCRFLMVGDHVQLAPIGPGLIFHLLVETQGIEHIPLIVTKRQKSSTGIPVIANAIRVHEWPEMNRYDCQDTGVSFKPCSEKEIRKTVLSIYDEIGASEEDTRIIAPTKNHVSGVTQLNLDIQNIYRVNDEHIKYWNEQYDCNANTGYKVNDNVMWLVNDYARDLRNGSLGVITEAFDGSNGYVCRVDFEGNILDLKLEDINKETISLAYCITGHKAQGSQFKRIIVPIYKWSRMDQSWIYTAVTRGVEQVVFVGDVEFAKARVHAESTAASRIVGLRGLLQRALSKKNEAA